MKQRLPPIKVLYDARHTDQGGIRLCAAMKVKSKRTILCTRHAAELALGLDFCRQHAKLARERGVKVAASNLRDYLNTLNP